MPRTDLDFGASEIELCRQIWRSIVFQMRYLFHRTERNDCCALYIEETKLPSRDECYEISSHNNPSQSMDEASYSHIVFLHRDARTNDIILYLVSEVFPIAQAPMSLAI